MAYVCNACLEPIQIGASICPHCRTRRWGYEDDKKTVYVVQQPEPTSTYSRTFDEYDSPWEYFFVGAVGPIYGLCFLPQWFFGDAPIFSMQGQLELLRLVYLFSWPTFVCFLTLYPWHLHAKYNNWAYVPGAGYFCWPQLITYVGLNVALTEILHVDVYTHSNQTFVMAICTVLFIITYYCFPKLKH